MTNRGSDSFIQRRPTIRTDGSDLSGAEGGSDCRKGMILIEGEFLVNCRSQPAGVGGRGRGRVTYRRLLHEAGLQPVPDAVQVQVDAHQPQLAPPLDQLVRLHHQPLGGET